MWAGVCFLGVALLFVLNSLFVPLLQKDLEEGIPWFAVWLVRRAVRKLPAEHQKRFEEEWLAELTAIPGVMLFKLHFALGVLIRARSTSRAMRGLPPWWEEVLRRLARTVTRVLSSYVEAIQQASRERSQNRSFSDSFMFLGRRLMALARWLLPDWRATEMLATTETEAENVDVSKVSAVATLRLRTLSMREREILGLLAHGWSYQRIAEETFLGLNTVRTHVQNVLIKLGVHTEREAVAFVLEHPVVASYLHGSERP